MKIYFDKRLKDPTYYGQQGFRNGKKVTSKNIMNFGKHSELLKITDDPEAYVREEIRKWNEEYRSGKVEYTLSADFNQRVPHTNDPASSSTWLNIGYFFLQELMKGLRLRDFFHQKTKDRKITFDCYTISRFQNMPHGISLTPTMNSRILITSTSCVLWIYWKKTMTITWHGCSGRVIRS